MNEFDEYIHEERPTVKGGQSSRWNTALIWSVLVIVGFLVYEITARPAYGVSIICLKFGWKHFRTAFRLLRTDSNRHRGRVCFWLYLGAGLAKTAMMATIIMAGLTILFPQVVLAPRAPQLQGKPIAGWKEFFEAYTTALFGFVMSGAMTIMALMQEFRQKLKVWLDQHVEHNLNHKAWARLEAARRLKIARLLLGLDFSFFFLPLSLYWAVGWFPVQGQGWALQCIPVIIMGLLFFPGLLRMMRIIDISVQTS